MIRPSYSTRTLMLLVSLIAFGCWYLFTPTETDRVYAWLVKQDEDTVGTVWGIEAVFTPDIGPSRNDVFEELLLGTAKFDSEGHAFYHLAHDSAGGVFLLWARANNPAPPSVIYITSDGGYGVVAKSFLDFPHILAHGVSFGPYSNPPSVRPWKPRNPNSNFHVGRREVLRQFSEKVVERFGPLPPLEELVSGRNEINAEFRDWVARSSIHQTPRRPVKRKRRDGG